MVGPDVVVLVALVILALVLASLLAIIFRLLRVQRDLLNRVNAKTFEQYRLLSPAPAAPEEPAPFRSGSDLDEYLAEHAQRTNLSIPPDVLRDVAAQMTPEEQRDLKDAVRERAG